MKIGIITKVDNNNYGNRLQNYACQQFLIRQADDVETIRNVGQLNNKNDSKLINFLKRIKYRCVSIIKMIKNERYRKFIKFNKNINLTRKIYDDQHSPKENEYDLIFIGSDQVWNPNFDVPDLYFATFCQKEKRNSFSASFGVDNIKKEYRDLYKKRISGLNHISVRENQGKEIIKELTGREDVEVLVDPTMLLTKEEWSKLAIKPKQLKTKKYILTYFLGKLSETRKKEIDRVAKENDCEVIDIISKSSEFYKNGPSEFLYLEKNAFLICTDSFHSCVFAILFERPFIVFDREDSNAKMNSRLETLLKTFNLQDRWFDKEIKQRQLNIDYKDTKQLLEKEREKATNFISNIIGN